MPNIMWVIIASVIVVVGYLFLVPAILKLAGAGDPRGLIVSVIVLAYLIFHIVRWWIDMNIKPGGPWDYQ